MDTAVLEHRKNRGAFFGDRAIQARFIKRVEEHERADQMLQGYGYWKDGKGCSVGCSYHSGDHFASEREANIPVQITYLQDAIFERLPIEEARKWSSRFFHAPKPGADLAMVWPKFAIWLLTDPEHGMVSYVKNARVLALLPAIAALYQRRVDGDEPSKAEWNAVRDESRNAYYAARDARAALDARAARDARDARHKVAKLAAEKLLALMSEAPSVASAIAGVEGGA